MLAGEQGTGKTTIARHLVGKQPTRFRKSTDGIELYNGLSYFDRETKEWLGGQQDFSLEEITVCRSLSRADTTTQKQNVPSADTTTQHQNVPLADTTTQHQNVPLADTTTQHQHVPSADTTTQHQNVPSADTTTHHQNDHSADTTTQHQNVPSADTTTQHQHLPSADTTTQHQHVPSADTTTQYQNFPSADTTTQHQNVPSADTTTQHQNVPSADTTTQHQHVPSADTTTQHQNVPSADTTTQHQNVPSADTTPTSQNISDVTEEASMSANEEWLKHKSNESKSCVATLSTECFMTEAVKAKKLPEPQFQTVPGCANSLAIRMEKKLPGHVAVQKSERVDNDDIYKSDEQDVLRSLERQSVISEFDGESSGTRNELVVLDYTTENQTSDVTKYRQIHEPSFDEYKPMEDSLGASLKSGFTGDLQTVTKPGIIARLKRVFGITKQVKEVKVSITKKSFLEKSSKVGKKKLHNRKIAPIIIWDFGGQDVFYSTHQSFLTYRAIYIIVLDGSRKLDDPCLYEQYLPGKSGHKTSRDYLQFWINTIVTYCKGSIQGFPKILVVLTHKDKLNTNEIEQRRHDIFEEIYKMFHKTPLMQQLVLDEEIFVNAKDKHDPEMAKIKAAIIRESERQPTWGEHLPKCFIPLELEFASLIRRNISLITLDHLKKINSLQPIRPLSETELKVFLKFQHSIGKLLYFDEHKLADRIILSPTLLIDAFKSIVTDRRFCEGDKKREEIWDAMGKKGVVSKQAIESVWKGKKYAIFYKDKDYLLNVMTHLDILVEPKRYGSDHKRITADFYYVASMVRAIDESGYLQSADITKRNIAIAFLSSSMMIPPALSFRFISYCLYVWAVKTYGETNRDMLFHRSGVFTVDPSVDMYVLCEDERIVVRLVHAETNTLIMRDMASALINVWLLPGENQSLYIKTSSDESQHIDASFITSICCNSPDNPCTLPLPRLANIDNIWTCPSHGLKQTYIQSHRECRDRGWQTWNCPVEVGCVGFPVEAVLWLFSEVGVTGRHKSPAI
ncbi:Hypothetical predicted protein [Mytilus galloprovincialis]|uniref:COR domain-containing protein n=1 Tax=Mytilus galloprovincialis TaxID=29158 RepID=A0A8B6HS33_MYTGA|nr:Hypothetical predicted protein [Mytilus galloprovincialis]